MSLHQRDRNAVTRFEKVEFDLPVAAAFHPGKPNSHAGTYVLLSADDQSLILYETSPFSLWTVKIIKKHLLPYDRISDLVIRQRKLSTTIQFSFQVLKAAVPYEFHTYLRSLRKDSPAQQDLQQVLKLLEKNSKNR